MQQEIIIVSGLPRSGTSLMMQLLGASGITLCTDHKRQADPLNEKGYYEFEKVKSLAADNAWLHLHRGQALKVISHLLPHLPATVEYNIVFMQRDINSVIRSQDRMLAVLGKPADATQHDLLVRKYTEHLNQIVQWIAAQKNMRLCTLEFERLFATPSVELARLDAFLKLDLGYDQRQEIINSRLKHF